MINTFKAGLAVFLAIIIKTLKMLKLFITILTKHKDIPDTILIEIVLLWLLEDQQQLLIGMKILTLNKYLMLDAADVKSIKDLILHTKM